MRVALGDGRLVKSGGKVVKNVAGYDAHKLHIGALGTLGVIVSVTFKLAPLSELVEGTRATIVRLAEHDGELLHWFYDEGLVPGTKIQVTSAQPAAGQFTVRLNGDERVIGEKAAGGLYVRPA